MPDLRQQGFPQASDRRAQWQKDRNGVLRVCGVLRSFSQVATIYEMARREAVGVACDRHRSPRQSFESSTARSNRQPAGACCGRSTGCGRLRNSRIASSVRRVLIQQTGNCDGRSDCVIENGTTSNFREFELWLEPSHKPWELRNFGDLNAILFQHILSLFDAFSSGTRPRK